MKCQCNTEVARKRSSNYFCRLAERSLKLMTRTVHYMECSESGLASVQSDKERGNINRNKNRMPPCDLTLPTLNAIPFFPATAASVSILSRPLCSRVRLVNVSIAGICRFISAY